MKEKPEGPPKGPFSAGRAYFMPSEFNRGQLKRDHKYLPFSSICFNQFYWKRAEYANTLLILEPSMHSFYIFFYERVHF